MKLKDHLVKIWNKAVGSRVKFSDGTIYQTQADGSIRRLSPLKPWRNKSERRQVIRRRRENRDAAAKQAGFLRQSAFQNSIA